MRVDRPKAPRTTVDRLRHDLEWIAVPRHPGENPAAHRAVREGIASSLRASLPSWRVREEPFTIRDGDEERHGVNVVADAPVSDLSGDAADGGAGASSDQWIVLGAHYDTVPGTPGADDNGSAVAALLECARQIGTRPQPPRRHRLRLAAFDLEERQGGAGGLFGSRAACADWTARGDRMAAMLCLEMVGYRDGSDHSQRLPPGLGESFPELRHWLDARSWRGDFLAAVGDGRSIELLRHVSEAALEAVPELPILPFAAPVEDLETFRHADILRSDHAAFWEIGVPALMLTDTSEFRNPHYHGAEDRIETLDLPFLAAVSSVVTATLERLLSAT